ncbi:MAG: hypothetical protein GY719_08405, partial [bacterium]|nr:hypothetical protein [bacterium]
MSEDCPSCERYLHDHAEVFAELAALREKLKEYDTAWLDARKEIPGRESADLSPFVMLHAIRELAALWGGARDGRARLREKCERLEKIAGKPGDDRKHWKGQAEEQIRRKRVHEKYKDEFKTRAEAAEQRAE